MIEKNLEFSINRAIMDETKSEVMRIDKEILNRVSSVVKDDIMDTLKKGHVTMDLNEAFVRLLIDDVNRLRTTVKNLERNAPSRASARPIYTASPEALEKKFDNIYKDMKKLYDKLDLIANDPNKLIRHYINNFSLNKGSKE